MRFLLKNLLLRLFPHGYGFYRRLRSLRDPAYVHELHKHPVRRKHHGKEGWKPRTGGPLRYRDYGGYEEYVVHQSQKFDEMLKLAGGLSARDILGYRLKFHRRFRHLKGLLPRTARILCLGARQGTEVEVLRDIGFEGAMGVDLNPGPGNPYVVQGDFMRLDCESGSVDLVYSNCVDHAFDLEKFFAEHARVVRPGGYALYDLALGEGQGAFEAVQWDSPDAVIPLMLSRFTELVKTETEPGWKWLLLRKAG